MSVRRVDQDMAAAAAGLLLPAGELTSAERKALRTRYRQLRVMLHTAGLAATYAFVASKAGGGGALERAYEEAAAGIRRRLISEHLLDGGAASADARKVLRQLGEMGGMRYARASAEAASLMGWLSRLADACYHEDEQDAGGGQDDGQAGTS
jgi:CRISPR/Cas system CMR-associated protein Cmr5 small subunit